MNKEEYEKRIEELMATLSITKSVSPIKNTIPIVFSVSIIYSSPSLTVRSALHINGAYRCSYLG